MFTGDVTYSGVTAVFTPTSILPTNTTYTATITTGAEDPQVMHCQVTMYGVLPQLQPQQGLAQVDLGTAGNFL